MVRTDQAASSALINADAWESPVFESLQRIGLIETTSDGKRTAASLSGHERNRLFLNRRGQRFDDVSLISGLDTDADSRGFAIWDFDRDGWTDIALVNANRPQLNIYRNQMGQQPHMRDRRVIAVRLVGGNRSGASTNKWSSSDAIGAMVTVTTGDLHLKRELRCGEGFAAQNSATLLFGLAERSQAERIDVQWPSGQQQHVTSVPAGTMVVIYENAADSDDKSGVERTNYHVNEAVNCDK